MRVLIVDDEPLARARLRSLLAEIALPGLELVGEAADGREAITQCDALAADTVLLDIGMPGLDGLEAARHLARFAEPPAVIFCTAFDAHALAAFEARAIDYLLKPIRADRLSTALERAARLGGSGQRREAIANDGLARSHLCARVRGSLRLVPIEEIAFLLAEDKYVLVHADSGEVLVDESLKSLETEFAGRFVRIHRNCLIARDRLIALERSADASMHARLRGAQRTLEISRRCLPALRSLVKQL
ncbi:MAG: LytR/AlgR family response regulator transcription factor [Lysobacterales bacterium]